MRIAIVQFPGSNCERETKLAVKRAGMEAVEFLWNESSEQLAEMDGYIIVGGFSYEDRSRAGIIAALDPVMHCIKKQSELGKPVLGICNGAQILVETGLVPGVEDYQTVLALAENKRVTQSKVLGTGYYNAWVQLRLSDHYQRNAFTKYLCPQDILRVPVAHAEGRFIMPPALLEEVSHQGLAVFQYCDEQGNIIDHFPVNPNGSMMNIAALSNKAGNVMAMMPHPERCLAGDPIFSSMRDYIQHRPSTMSTTPLYYYPRPVSVSNFQAAPGAHVLTVVLMITDNHALTVQQTLRQLGIPVRVERQVHWEVSVDSAEAWEQIKASGVLFNPRKEKEVPILRSESPKSMSILVRAREDWLGEQQRQILSDHFNIKGITQISHGILWHFVAENANIRDLTDLILKTNIICNPYAHDSSYIT